jgi:hypothetical protein
MELLPTDIRQELFPKQDEMPSYVNPRDAEKLKKIQKRFSVSRLPMKKE